MPMNQGLKVILYMTDMEFDPEDDVTRGVYKDQIMYYFYHDDRLVKRMYAKEAKQSLASGNNGDYTLYLKPS